MPGPLTGPEDLPDVMRGWMIVIDGLRIARRSSPVVLCELLNGGPVGQQPRLEIMLRDMGMETIVRADPDTHFLLCISGVLKVVGAGIDIGQRDHVVGVWISSSKQGFDDTFQPLLLRDSAVVLVRNQPGHLTLKSRAEEVAEVGEKDSFGFTFHQNCDLHPRAPRRPLRQSSSRAYSSNH
jgi:hypothetical protein